MSSIDSPPAREKFSLLNTVVTIFQEPFISLRRRIKYASLKKLCATLIGFNSAELRSCEFFYNDMTDYSKYIFGAGTESLAPEPVLSHRLANLAILCMQYLLRLDFDTLQTWNKFPASWATRSKQLPWLWRRRMRVTHEVHKCSSPPKLRRSPPIIYSGTIQSHQEQRIFYTWTLDLLYYTLREV